MLLASDGLYDNMDDQDILRVMVGVASLLNRRSRLPVAIYTLLRVFVDGIGDVVVMECVFVLSYPTKT